MAVLCGISLAAVCFLKVLLVDRLLMHNESISLSVDLVICLALGVTVVMAKMVGCTLPLLAKRLGFDPAVMASPFITTIVDALSLLILLRLCRDDPGPGLNKENCFCNITRPFSSGMAALVFCAMPWRRMRRR